MEFIIAIGGFSVMIILLLATVGRIFLNSNKISEVEKKVKVKE